MVSIEKISEMLDSPICDTDTWTIRCTGDSRYGLFDYEDGDAQVHIGPRYDGLYAVVATETQHIGTVGEIPQTREYRSVRAIEDVIEEATDLCNKYESQIAKQASSPKTVSIEEVVDRLTEEGSQFLAIPEHLLAYGVFGVVIGGDDDIDTSSIARYWKDIGAVQVGDSSLPCGPAIPTQHWNFHFGGRVPLYASDRLVSSLETVGSKQGLENAQNYVKKTRGGQLAISTKAGDLESILADLVDAGAAAIALEDEVSHSNRLTFSVYIQPAIGYELVAKYSSVEVDEREINVDWECQINGPNFAFRTPVFVSGDFNRLDSVPLSDGLTNIREFVNAPQNLQTGDTQ